MPGLPTRSGSREASPDTSLDDLFQRQYVALVAWCRRRVRPYVGDPEEFVHLAYIRCRKSWSAPRRSRHNEAAYLYQALRWVILDALRRHVRATRRQARLTDPAVAPALGRDCPPHLADEAVQVLPRRQRQVCQAILAGKSTDQIRDELKLTPSALSVHLCRARAALGALLGIPLSRPRAGEGRSTVAA